MKPKVIITVQGGIVQNVCANTNEIDIIILDYDSDNLEEPVIIAGPSKPDCVFEDGRAYEILKENDPYPLSDEEKLVKQHLIEVNF